MEPLKVSSTVLVSEAEWPGEDSLCVKLDYPGQMFPEMYLVSDKDGSISELRRYSYWLRDNFKCE